MNAPTIARILGVLFLLVGIAGAIPWISPPHPMDAPVITLDFWYRDLATLFPVNVVLDGAYLVFGVWGWLAAFRFGSSVGYCRIMTWIFLLLVILGGLPVFAFYTLFGVAPIYGWDVLLHFVILLVAAYGGYGRASQAPEEVSETPA